MSNQTPCGKTMGHGYSCDEHILCSQCKCIRDLQSKLDAMTESLRDMPVHKPVKISTDVRDKFPVGDYVLVDDIKGILGDVEDE